MFKFKTKLNESKKTKQKQMIESRTEISLINLAPDPIGESFPSLWTPRRRSIAPKTQTVENDTYIH